MSKEYLEDSTDDLFKTKPLQDKPTKTCWNLCNRSLLCTDQYYWSNMRNCMEICKMKQNIYGKNKSCPHYN